MLVSYINNGEESVRIEAAEAVLAHIAHLAVTVEAKRESHFGHRFLLEIGVDHKVLSDLAHADGVGQLVHIGELDVLRHVLVDVDLYLALVVRLDYELGQTRFGQSELDR